MLIESWPYLAAACVVLSIPFLVFALAPGSSRAARTRRVLRRGLGTDASSGDRTAAYSGLAKVGRSLTPSAWFARLDRWHSAAGRPSRWPLERVMATKVILAALGGALGAVVLLATVSGRSVLVALLAMTLGWMLPDLLLLNAGIKRRQAIELALPDVLDQLSIAVEAGLGFEGALNHVARSSGGPLGEEITRTLQDMRVGVPRREAYLDLARRTGVSDLRRFVRAIVQAEQRGVSVSRVLSVQAGEMRLKRGQRAEESAMQIPVKVVFPLMFCILPALFVVILGPAAINIMQTFPR